MATPVTPHLVAADNNEIEKIVRKVRTALRRARPGISSVGLNKILANNSFGSIAHNVARDVVLKAEVAAGMAIRRGRALRELEPHAMFAQLKFRLHGDGHVTSRIQRGTDANEVIFFKIDLKANKAILHEEYERRGLAPADPYIIAGALAAQRYSEIRFTESVCTVWRDLEWEEHGGKGYRYALEFSGDNVAAFMPIGEFSSGTWFAGVKK